jgi:hypothetical protein
MTEGPGQGPLDDDTVALGPDAELPEPFSAPASPPPPPPGPAVADGGERAGGSSPWRTRPPGAGGTPPPEPPPTVRGGGPLGPGPTGPSGPPPRRGDSNAVTLVAVGGVVVLVVVIVLMAVVLGFGGDDDGDDVATGDSTASTTASTEATTTSTTTTTTTPPTTTAPPPAVTIIVGGPELAPGLFCRDLLAQGATYDEAVAYWLGEGRPTRMDDDGNGIPCETVYPAADVESVWGPQGLEEEGVTPGLFCRDLPPLGLDYEAAVAYWFQEGQPERMDDDGNGRPCETVYPTDEVQAFWG